LRAGQKQAKQAEKASLMAMEMALPMRNYAWQTHKSESKFKCDMEIMS